MIYLQVCERYWQVCERLRDVVRGIHGGRVLRIKLSPPDYEIACAALEFGPDGSHRGRRLGVLTFQGIPVVPRN